MKNQINPIRISKVLLIIILFISACSKDDDVVAPPSVILIQEAGYVSTDTTLAAGEEIRVKVKLEAGDLNITNFLIDVFTDEHQTYFDTGMNTSGLIWEGSFSRSLAPVEEWTFIVHDREGNSGSTTLTINLDTSSSYQSLTAYPSLILGGQDNDQAGGCVSTTDGSIYFHTDAAADTLIQASIDLLYFYIAGDENTIASPGANIDDGIFPVNPANWTIVNTTRYYKTGLAAEDFDTAVNDSIILANFNEGEAKRKAKNLDQDDIYTFKTQSGKLGIFLVNESEGTNTGFVNIDIKIQQ